MGQKLSGKVAAITGAASGIGLECSRILLSEGAQVVLVDRDGDALRSVQAELGSNAIPLTVDVTDPASVSAMMGQILDRTGRGIEPPWNIGKLGSDLDAVLKRVHIAARVSADSPGELATMLSGGLSGAGFLIETGQNPDYLMEASLKLNDMGIQDSWYWFRGTLEIKLSEQANGRIRGTKRWEIKSSGQQQTVARQRAIEETGAILKKDLYNAIIGFVTN